MVGLFGGWLSVFNFANFLMCQPPPITCYNSARIRLGCDFVPPNRQPSTATALFFSRLGSASRFGRSVHVFVRRTDQPNPSSVARLPSREKSDPNRGSGSGLRRALNRTGEPATWNVMYVSIEDSRRIEFSKLEYVYN